ncbi:ABC transporter substrate-binding protein [Paenalcaligenes sp. Me131]|uniref:ABC transporter substrate-binding protein n=1 Tax=Paenalcaligenes sp. Me131 TaxID=3392636 RepID=UPI003D2C20A3
MERDKKARRLRVLLKHETIALVPNGFNSDSSSSTAILRLTCQGLLKQDFDGKLVPDLAQSWSVSDDLRRYTFQLRKGLTFHNGNACNAHKVAWNFTRLFNGGTDSLLTRDYQDIEAVNVLSEHELEFVLKRPNAAFLPNLAWRTYIVDDTYDQPCGTGPLRLQTWQRGSHVLLSRFEGYQGVHAAPDVDEVRLEFAPGIEQRVARIRQGDIDIVESVPSSAAEALAAEGLLHSALTASKHRSVMYFNCKKGALTTPKVRLALAHAINREALMHAVTGGTGEVVDGMLAASDPAFVTTPTIAYDPDRARQLLQEAGVSSKHVFRMVTTNTAPFSQVAEQVGKDLRAIGLTVQFTGYDDPPWWPYMYLRGGWDICLQGTPARPHLDTLLVRELHSQGGFNAGGYACSEMDSLIDGARGELDVQKRQQAYARIQHKVQAELPFFSLFAMDNMVGWSPRVTGFTPHPSGGIDLSGVQIRDANVSPSSFTTEGERQ